jgi:hypothetical protein
MAKYNINGAIYETPRELTSDELAQLAGQKQQQQSGDSVMRTIGKALVKAPLTVGVTAAKAMGASTEGSLLDFATGGRFSKAVESGEFGDVDATGNPLKAIGALAETALNVVGAPVRGAATAIKAVKLAKTPLSGTPKILKAAVEGVKSLAPVGAAEGLAGSLQRDEGTSVARAALDTAIGAGIGVGLGGIAQGGGALIQKIKNPIENKAREIAKSLAFDPNFTTKQLNETADKYMQGASYVKSFSPNADLDKRMSTTDVADMIQKAETDSSSRFEAAVQTATDQGLHIQKGVPYEIDSLYAELNSPTLYNTPAKEKASRFVKKYVDSIRRNGYTPTSIVENLKEMNAELRTAYKANKVTSAEDKVIMKAATKIRGILDKVVDRKTYGEAYGSVQALKEALVKIGKKHGVEPDPTDAIIDSLIDVGFAVGTGNPFYMVRSAGTATASYLTKLYKNKKALSEVRQLFKGAPLPEKTISTNPKFMQLPQKASPSVMATESVAKPSVDYVADVAGNVQKTEVNTPIKVDPRGLIKAGAVVGAVGAGTAADAFYTKEAPLAYEWGNIPKSNMEYATAIAEGESTFGQYGHRDAVRDAAMFENDNAAAVGFQKAHKQAASLARAMKGIFVYEATRSPKDYAELNKNSIMRDKEQIAAFKKKYATELEKVLKVYQGSEIDVFNKAKNVDDVIRITRKHFPTTKLAEEVWSVMDFTTPEKAANSALEFMKVMWKREHPTEPFNFYKAYKTVYSNGQVPATIEKKYGGKK